MDKDHTVIKIHHLAEYYKHWNVTFNIQMLQHSKVRLNVEHSFVQYYVHVQIQTQIHMTCTQHMEINKYINKYTQHHLAYNRELSCIFAN